MKTTVLTKTIWILSWVSLFGDFASEMLYPIMPLYLKEIGFSIVLIGVLEGLVEAVAGFSKGYFGQLSDKTGLRLPFVKGGYFLSAISKPLLVAFTMPYWVFFVRIIDRLGKGLRSSPRDAILSAETNAANKGFVFGFHRSMDTVGAVMGPLVALLFLHFYPGNYKVLFLIAFLPGIISFSLTFFASEKPFASRGASIRVPFFGYLGYWKKAGSGYKKVVVGLLAFALLNSSDVFLLLKIKESGFTDTQMLQLYIFYNMVFALFAFPIGKLADLIGLKRMLIAGLVLFSVVYGWVGFLENSAMAWGVFFLYGLFAASTDGISKALVSNLCNKEETATALGFLASLNSVMALAASTLAGLIWYGFSSVHLFVFASAGSLIVSGYFIYNSKSMEI